MMSLMRNNTAQLLLSLAAALGGEPEQNQRRLRSKFKAVVSEVFSPPRATAAWANLADLEINPGLA